MTVPPTPCSAARTLSVVILRVSKEQCGVARPQGLRRLFHEIVVDPDIGEGATERPAGGAERSADQRHKEDHADQCAPECAAYGSGRRRMEQLVELETELVAGLFGDAKICSVSSAARQSAHGVLRLPPTVPAAVRRPDQLASSSIFGTERSASRPPLGAARHRRVIDRLHVDAVAL